MHRSSTAVVRHGRVVHPRVVIHFAGIRTRIVRGCVKVNRRPTMPSSAAPMWTWARLVTRHWVWVIGWGIRMGVRLSMVNVLVAPTRHAIDVILCEIATPAPSGRSFLCFSIVSKLYYQRCVWSLNGIYVFGGGSVACWVRIISFKQTYITQTLSNHFSLSFISHLNDMFSMKLLDSFKRLMFVFKLDERTVLV